MFALRTILILAWSIVWYLWNLSAAIAVASGVDSIEIISKIFLNVIMRSCTPSLTLHEVRTAVCCFDCKLSKIDRRIQCPPSTVQTPLESTNWTVQMLERKSDDENGISNKRENHTSSISMPSQISFASSNEAVSSYPIWSSHIKTVTTSSDFIYSRKASCY